jgi:hypothetical protein
VDAFDCLGNLALSGDRWINLSPSKSMSGQFSVIVLDFNDKIEDNYWVFSCHFSKLIKNYVGKWRDNYVENIKA